MSEDTLLLPDWQLPTGVFACVTMRRGGCSQPPWDSFNLGDHVGDEATAVSSNRLRLRTLLQQYTGLAELPMQWVQQVHGTTVLSLPDSQARQPAPVADAIHTRARGIACAVLTADCLPVLFCADDGGEIAVAHAGWRGLLGGILERTVQQFAVSPGRILAWLGPAIGSCHFEVGPEVRSQFLAVAPAGTQAATDAAFTAGAGGKYYADLYALARLRLQALGLEQVAGAPCCTVCDAERWYSYRRDGATGRFATLIMRS